MPNATMVKFGYPRTSVADTAQWSIQLRPQQPTLGSLVLVCKGEAQAFSDIGAEAFADLQHAIAGIERMLGAFVAYQRINYLMLMMVDPHVHFHVVPRYEEFPYAVALGVEDPARLRYVFDDRYFMASTELNLLNTLLLADEERANPDDTVGVTVGADTLGEDAAA
mgnify:CR=1 FL=1